MSYPNKLSIYIVFLSLIFTSAMTFANGGGGEEKKEEGGEAKAEGKAESGDAVDKQYSQGLLKVQNLRVRQEERRKEIDELTEKRRKAHTYVEQKALRDQMIEIEKQYKKDAKEIEELEIQLQYRYPDLGEKKKREYAPSGERKPSSESETDSLEDILGATKAAMEEQYGKPEKKKSQHPNSHGQSPSAGGGKLAE